MVILFDEKEKRQRDPSPPVAGPARPVLPVQPPPAPLTQTASSSVQSHQQPYHHHHRPPSPPSVSPSPPPIPPPLPPPITQPIPLPTQSILAKSTCLVFLLPSLLISLAIAILAVIPGLPNSDTRPFLILPTSTILHHILFIAVILARKETLQERWPNVVLIVLSVGWYAGAGAMIALALSQNPQTATTQTAKDAIALAVSYYSVQAALSLVEGLIVGALGFTILRAQRKGWDAQDSQQKDSKKLPVAITYLGFIFPSIVLSAILLALAAIDSNGIIATPVITLVHHAIILSVHIRHYQRAPADYNHPAHAAKFSITLPPMYYSRWHISIILFLLLIWVASAIIMICMASGLWSTGLTATDGSQPRDIGSVIICAVEALIIALLCVMFTGFGRKLAALERVQSMEYTNTDYADAMRPPPAYHTNNFRNNYRGYRDALLS